MEYSDHLEQIKRELAEVIREEFIETWLHKENPAFEHRKPINMIRSGEILPIRRMIHELLSGQPG